MAVILLAVLDISKGMILKQEVYNAAHSIAVIASIQAVQSDKSTTLTPTAAQTSMSAIWAEIPWLRSGVASGYTVVTLSSVVFTNSSSSCNPATATCTYTPNRTGRCTKARSPLAMFGRAAPRVRFRQIIRSTLIMNFIS
jgi:hypothetical protein